MRNAPKRLFRPKTQISGNEIFRQALQESPVHHLRDSASFRRAEIFARCGEIYLVRILGVESSLLEPDLGYAYPESEVLDSIIQNYYQVLLKEKLACSVFAKAC